MDGLFEALSKVTLPIVALAAAIGAFLAVRSLTRKRRVSLGGAELFRNLALLGISLALLAFAIVGIPDTLESSQLVMGLLGLALTTVLTLSSTSFLTNAMAGLMLRSVRSFRPGDWISVGDQFGIVTEQGLFHIEIQTENRDLATLPNLYLVSHPVTVARAKGTLVRATLSLGYDEPHAKIERLLVRAARVTGLESPFVRVLELGDYSVTYNVSGLLKEDVSKLIEVRSRLNVNILDTMHLARVEIVSPMFMNQRQVSPDELVIAEPMARPAPDKSDESREVVFHKATLVAERRDLGVKLEALRKQLAEAPATEHDAIDAEIASTEQRIDLVDEALEADELDDVREE